MRSIVAVLSALSACLAQSAPKAIPSGFTEHDVRRGSITDERAWWDVRHYDLSLDVHPDSKSIQGVNVITFAVLDAGDRMQIDLQPPLQLDEARIGDAVLAFERQQNVYWISLGDLELEKGRDYQLRLAYGGRPRQSTRPPWSGGFSWRKDDHGDHFIATTCQGIGASIWWPNKDHGYDEPDRGMDVRVTVPKGLVAVSNGRLKERSDSDDGKRSTFHWQVTNPINNYGVNVNIGNYVSIDGTYEGEGGTLDLQYWMLAHQVEQAKKQFAEVPRTLAAFEHWFGRYPFYEDSYKIVVVPYLGMEHQSSVTYGNGFQNGYRGRDLSRTGVGMKFDFIVVHESAHEWWGNNISMKDAADMWIHESFANYAENLFVEYHFTEKEAQDYVIGCRALIRNDRPIIGTYGVNHSGSGDMYYKGGNMLHTMRHVLDDDVRWRKVLRGLNEHFWHQTIGTAEFEAYMSRECGFDFGKVFDQYLRTTRIPVLCRSFDDDAGELVLWFEGVVPGFEVPVAVTVNGAERRVTVGEQKVRVPVEGALESFELDRNYYMTVEER
ncbi:MAG: M1 family metallopeptidase [Planctomycetota bacterium]